jgi:DNA-binding GntR family transcriptional regulator
MALQNDIYNRLKTAIIYGELNPGEKLSEIEFAKKMNVSRTPIREAFRQLQAEGYITVFVNRGAYVSKIPVEEIAEIYDIVSLLEGHAAGLAAKSISESGLKELKRLQHKLAVLASKNKYHDHFEMNIIFHQRIRELSGNASLAKIVAQLRARIYTYRLTSTTIPGRLERYTSDHAKIVAAIAKGDSAQARKCMMNHVTLVKKTLTHFLRSNQSSVVRSGLLPELEHSR